MRDEQAETDAFEQACGGVERAQALFRIWQNCHAVQHPNPRYSKTREQVFEGLAQDAGFTAKQIRAFYNCQ